MSFASLIRDAPTGERIKLKGGQSQGNIGRTNEKISVDKYIPPKNPAGSEHLAKYRLEEDQKYFESMASAMKAVPRTDVTSGEGTSQMFEPEELTSIGTLPNLRELDREQLTQVYQNYNFEPLKPAEHLVSIYTEREKIVRLIEANQVCIIKGQTGCGKSTQIPQFILDSYVERRAHCSIVVTQPRRIAAISLAQRVCEERKWEIPGIVGYQVALDKQVGEDTRLLYCTTGVLLEKLINAKNLHDYTHVFLDEVHEREEDMDFLMLIVKKFLRSNSPNVKVILMSATMDVSKFAKYFEVYLRNEKQPAPYYEIKNQRQFDVQVHYLDALSSLGNLPTITLDNPTISKEAYMLVPMMIRAFNTIDAEDFRCKRSLEQRSAVLIFLPGLHQIETLYELLSSEDAKNKGVFNLWLCPLHSSITKDEQEKVRRYAPQGKRKVILSTNIAESSVTIIDVKYVIDFCLTKHLVADAVTGFTSLQLAWASRINCTQREGRVGRVQDGRVYRLVTRSFYNCQMLPDSIAEMQRCPLEIIVLKCKRLMEEEEPLRLISCALDPPDLHNYEKTVLKLKEIGALLTTCRKKENPNDGDLTFMGLVMSSLPLDIHITKLILLGHAFDVLEETIIMGCAMSVRNLFSEPFQRRLESYNNKLLWADSSESDAVAYLNAYQVWRQLTGIGRFSRSVGSEDAWGRRYMVQIKHLQEVAKQEDDIKKRLGFFNIKVVRHKNNRLWSLKEKPLILKMVLAGAFYPYYYSCSAQNPNAECEAVKVLAGHSPYNSVYLQNMPHPAPIYLDQVKECIRRKGVSDDVKLYYDDSRKLVVEFNAGQTSGEEKFGETTLNRKIPGEIVMPVYRAIKLRQLNEPISIKTLSPQQAKEELQKLSAQSRSSMLSVASSDYRPVISLQQQHIEINVCHVVNAGNFYAHIYPSDEKVVHIHSILNRQNLLRPVSGEPVDNITYAAPYREEDDSDYSYYRARILKTFYMQDVMYVNVFFIDYGNSTHLPFHELREVTSERAQAELDKIPPLALECVLAEVCPTFWSQRGGQWDEEANAFVKKILLTNRSCFAKVYSYINNVASLIVYLEGIYNVNMPSDKPHPTLNKELIKRNFARPREESYFSKLNHAKRKEMEKNGIYDQSMLCTDEDGTVARSLNKEFLALPTNSERSYVELRGPNSPLEMKLFSKVKCSTQRDVRIEWNSVNSILLDSDPTDPHERLLVAGMVTQSTDGRRLILNHTTVLPNMHGLAALMCLIFAPYVELRTDEWRSRYTGALCGLGPQNIGSSMFPENDMEIKFDVNFSDEDLINVNKLRYWLNQRFCSDSSEDMPDADVINLHKHIRTLTCQLLKPVRPTVKVVYNSRPFMWNLVNKNYLRLPFPEFDAALFSDSIYQLHYGVEINPENDRSYIEGLLKKLEKLNTTLNSGLTPRHLNCELCDLDFEYCNLLRLHMSSSHHKQLFEWLTSRIAAYKLPSTSGAPSTSSA